VKRIVGDRVGWLLREDGGVRKREAGGRGMGEMSCKGKKGAGTANRVLHGY